MWTSVQCSNTCKKYVYYSGFVFLYERRESNGNYQPELATVYNYIINHNNDQTTINRIWYYCMFLVPYRFHQMGLKLSYPSVSHYVCPSAPLQFSTLFSLCVWGIIWNLLNSFKMSNYRSSLHFCSVWLTYFREN